MCSHTMTWTLNSQDMMKIGNKQKIIQPHTPMFYYHYFNQQCQCGDDCHVGHIHVKLRMMRRQRTGDNAVTWYRSWTTLPPGNPIILFSVLENTFCSHNIKILSNNHRNNSTEICWIIIFNDCTVLLIINLYLTVRHFIINHSTETSHYNQLANLVNK